MKKSMKARAIALAMFCCMLVTVLPVQNVQAQVYNSTLQFGTGYQFTGEGGSQKFDLVLPKSGRVTFNFIAENSGDESGIYLYDETGENELSRIEFGGSYKYDLDVKAGNYQVVFTRNSHSDTNFEPAKGQMVATFTDANETFAESTLITNDESGVASEIGNIGSANIVGQFAVNDSVDYYSFDVKKSQNITISYVAPMSSSSIHIYKDTLDLENWQNDLAAGSHKVTLTFPQGHYYIAINNNSNVTGVYNLTMSGAKISTANIKSLRSTAKKSITVKYGKVSSVDKYQIQIAANSKFTKSVKTYTTTATSKKITKLGSKKKYYVRVRTITMANNYKCYSDWSKTKSVKVK